jgi:hypothetical protein
MHVQTISLGAAMAPMHCKARRVHYEVLHPRGHQTAVEPEPIAAGLVATDDAGVLGDSKTLLGPSDLLMQDVASPCRHTTLPRPRRRPDGEAKLPGIDAQCKGEKQGRLMCGCLIHAGSPLV